MLWRNLALEDVVNTAIIIAVAGLTELLRLDGHA